MQLNNTNISGLFVIQLDKFSDDRGVFIKTFNSRLFSSLGLECDYCESYFSISRKNVIRGMHFQTPDQDHVKTVYVTFGRILDVVLDIRKNSPTYGEFFFTEVSLENRKQIYIPKGCAHGFLSLEDNTTVVYNQSSVYSKDHDCGIFYDSFGMDWNVNEPIVSVRDQSFVYFDKYDSPFIYQGGSR